MILQYILVGIGGSLGAISRFVIEKLVNSSLDATVFPFGTLTVNVLGCFIIGFLFGIIGISQFIGPRARLVLITGFLGALTTFSSFGYETFHLISLHHYSYALVNIVSQLMAGLTAVWLGYTISRQTAKILPK